MAGPEARLTTCIAFRDPHRCRSLGACSINLTRWMTLRHLSFRLAYGNRRPEPWAGTGLPRKGSARPDLAPNWDIGAGRGPPRPLTLNRRHDRGAAIGRLTSKRRRGCRLHPGREAAEPGMRLRRRGGRIPHVHPLPVRTDFFRQCPFAWFGSSARQGPSPACESSGSAATGPFGSGPGPAEGAVLRRTVTNGITSESPSTLLPAGRQHHGRTTGRKIGPKLFG